MATTHRPTKAEIKRARVAAARAAADRVQRRARKLRRGLWSAAGVAVVALVVTAAVVLTRADPPAADAARGADAVPTAGTGQGPGATPASGTVPAPTARAVGRTTNPPWPAPTDAAAAVAAAGLPMLGEEGNALHIHTHLDVIVNGKPVQIPDTIGVDEAHHKISPLHSHDTTGVIHIESPTKSATFTLGQFFIEWQVSLSADHIGGLVADDTHHLKVYVNGVHRTGDPANIVLASHDQIAIVYGTDAQHTNVPSTYRWTNGL